MTDDVRAPRARGRPARSPARIEEVRGRIAACAFRLFHEEGYAAVSMRRLAEEAGYTVMTLYKYYDRKIDVLRDLWGRVFAELFDQLDEIAAANTDPAKRLQALAQAYVTFWLTRRDHYFLVFMSSGISQAEVSVFVRDDPLILRFGVILNALAEALGVAPTDPAVAVKADLLMAVLHGVAHNQITIAAYPWTPPQTLIRTAVEALVRADNPNEPYHATVAG
ncbi:MAG: TetR/AcrR family transcriptional regulator [Hyphomonadaceae bacterium]|nr:TetR/AcrR family transcriptional regulator [Hyphomonadaceae bacterium]